MFYIQILVLLNLIFLGGGEDGKLSGFKGGGELLP